MLYKYFTTTLPYLSSNSFRCIHYWYFKQAEARFLIEKLGRGEASVAERNTTAQFIRPARELYGLRYKRRTKHLPKSTVILHLAFSNILLRSSAKKSRRFLCVLHKEIYVMFFCLFESGKIKQNQSIHTNSNKKQKATLLRDSIFLLAFFQMPIKNRISLRNEAQGNVRTCFC